MSKEVNTPIEPVVEDVKSETTKEEVIVTDDNGGKNPTEEEKVGYVKIRVERAKTQAVKEVLKELGVETISDAKKLVANGTEALSEVQKLKEKLEQKEYEEEINIKKNLLIKLLDKEKVFDSEALINYLDLDKVKVENGEVQDSEAIITSLKQAKPNFFGKFETISDDYVKGQTTQPKTALDKQKAGDTVGAINDYLKEILK